MTGADSFASTSGNTDQWDFPGGAGALRAVERAEGATQMVRRTAEDFSAPAHTTEDSPGRTSSNTTKLSHRFSSGNHGDDEPSHQPTQGSHGDDDPSYQPTHGTYGDDEPSYQPSHENYGDDEPGYQPSHESYGDEEPAPEPPKAPDHPRAEPVRQPDHQTPPPAHQPPEMARTGAEETFAALAASGALLVAGTALYRGGRRAASQK
jgi:hypothetical protein